MATTADIRSGLIIKVDGSLYTVIEFEIGRASCRERVCT